MNAPDWRIPSSTMRWLAQISANKPVALLLRQWVREPLLPEISATRFR